MSYENYAVPADFDELADWLVLASSHFSPSELHGAIVGGLCGGMRLPGLQWAQFGLAVMGAERMVDGAEQVLGGLADMQLELLAGSDMAFQPFLPDDDETLENRTDQLAHWCRGFLGGFAEAQARQQSMPDRLPEAVEESLRDMAAIAQASGDAASAGFDDEDEFPEEDEWLDDDGLAIGGEPQDAEASERDYIEITEYLRFAALTVFTEAGWVEQQAAGELAEEQSGEMSGEPTGINRLFDNGNKTMH